ncbi:MAG: UDP-N-acetylmuramoyl-L-alanyl-D-glutamate--2,6-diaminopimelate ligase, partial [Planctomycetota bacterium]
MKASELLRTIGVPSSEAGADPEITSVECDSRKVKAGSCFVAIAGSNADGHDFAGEAVGRGARLVVVEREVAAPPGATVVKVEDTRTALARLAALWHGEPARALSFVGITGTNGKTTTAYLTHHIIETAGHKAGLLSTVERRTGARTRAASQTTAGPIELHADLAEMRANGLEYVVMEVSSHALDQRRVEGLSFRAAVFTNFTHDHLDYHQDMGSYLAAKLLLFRNLGADATAVVNGDDGHSGDFLRAASHAKYRTYAVDRCADFRALSVQTSIRGTTFTAAGPEWSLPVRTHLVGKHNVYNSLAATATAWALGVEKEKIGEALETFAGVPGRLERIDGPDFSAFVDYAHTDDALENVLGCLRRLTEGRLIVVFGCGGDRD